MLQRFFNRCTLICWCQYVHQFNMRSFTTNLAQMATHAMAFALKWNMTLNRHTVELIFVFCNNKIVTSNFIKLTIFILICMLRLCPYHLELYYYFQLNFIFCLFFVLFFKYIWTCITLTVHLSDDISFFPYNLCVYYICMLIQLFFIYFKRLIISQNIHFECFRYI